MTEGYCKRFQFKDTNVLIAQPLVSTAVCYAMPGYRGRKVSEV